MSSGCNRRCASEYGELIIVKVINMNKINYSDIELLELLFVFLRKKMFLPPPQLVQDPEKKMTM